MKLARESQLKEEYKRLSEQLDISKKKALEFSREKGSSAWLSALPLESLGYTLNKAQFRDALCLRFGWALTNVPQFCGCGSKNSIDHSLICKKGGYVSIRHDNIRDVEAGFLKEICKDVSTEPGLLPVNPENFNPSVNTTDQARLDIVATGLWGPMEKTFFDVRVTHPNASSYSSMTPEQLYAHHEKQKKRAYNERILQVEKASFCPLVFSTSGGAGPECNSYHRRVASLLSEKRREQYSSVINYIRTKIRFSLLKSVLMGIRGVRDRKPAQNLTPICAIPFGLIPEMDGYEC